MKTAVEIKALSALPGQKSHKNVDGEDIKPILEALLSNEFTLTADFTDIDGGTTGSIELTVTDGNGDALTSAVEIDIAFFASAGALYADLGTVTVEEDAGLLVHNFTDDVIQRVRTTATGTATVLLDGADEWFMRAKVVGAKQNSVLEDSYVVTDSTPQESSSSGSSSSEPE
jgi:hypothetical protein